MKNKEYLKHYLLQSLIVITIFSLLLVIVNTIEYNQYKRNFNYKINAILEKVEEKYPNFIDRFTNIFIIYDFVNKMQ